jgi:hypothetical protein
LIVRLNKKEAPVPALLFKKIKEIAPIGWSAFGKKLPPCLFFFLSFDEKGDQ